MVSHSSDPSPPQRRHPTQPPQPLKPSDMTTTPFQIHTWGAGMSAPTKRPRDHLKLNDGGATGHPDRSANYTTQFCSSCCSSRTTPQGPNVPANKAPSSGINPVPSLLQFWLSTLRSTKRRDHGQAGHLREARWRAATAPERSEWGHSRRARPRTSRVLSRADPERTFNVRYILRHSRSGVFAQKRHSRSGVERHSRSGVGEAL